MGTGRIPGPLGMRSMTGCVLRRGPMNPYAYFDEEFPQVTRGPMGTNKDPGAKLAESTDKSAKEDEDELKLLVKVYGAIKNRKGNKSYVYWKKKKRQYRVEDYVKDRNAFFGTATAYQTYRQKAHGELEADKKKLRRYIEPPLKKRKKVAGWEAAQDVFYAWVRKAYEKKLGDKVDIPKLINSQMSEKLKKALKQVKLDYGKSFQAGGFNPRPMKMNGYRLGTISEHAIGTAIDIESAKNAHIPTSRWNNILTFTGKSLNHATRKTKWKSKPKELYDEIKAVNEEFVKKLKKTMDDTVAEAKKIAEAENSTPQQKAAYELIKKEPLSAAINNSPALKGIGASFLKRWKNGFFSMPWELVKELHEEKFLWGATFSHPDLHHFEL